MYKLFLAWRYLFSRKIIFFSIAGVAVGVMVLIVVTSVMGGFSRDMRAKIRGISADLSVTTPEGVFLEGNQYNTLIDKIRVITHVVACAPRIEWLGTFATDDWPSLLPVQIVGVDPMAETKVNRFAEYLLDNKSPDFLLAGREPEYPGALIGAILSHRWISPAGQTFTLTTVRVQDGLISTTQQQFTIVGRFKIGLIDRVGGTIDDARTVYLSLKSLQKLLDVQGINKINIALDDYKYAGQVQKEIEKKIEDMLGRRARFLTIQTWEQEKGQLLKAVAVEKIINAIILFFVVIVAGFNIASMLTMRVVEKTKDIGILQSLGSRRSGIMSLFLYQGLLISLIGCLVGVISGYLIAANLNSIELTLSKLFGFKLFPPDIYYLDKIPSEISISGIIIIVVATIVCSVIFSIYPALKAARLLPVDALRYE